MSDPIEVKLYNALSTHAPLVAIVGTRIYPDRAYQSGGFPCVVYNRISGRRLWSMTGYSLLENPRFQFEIYARSVDELRTVYTTVLSALVATTLFKSNPIDSPDDYWVDETQTYMRMWDVSIWNQET